MTMPATISSTFYRSLFIIEHALARNDAPQCRRDWPTQLMQLTGSYRVSLHEYYVHAADLPSYTIASARRDAESEILKMPFMKLIMIIS